MINKTSGINIHFTGFAKFSGKPKHVKDLAEKVKNNRPDCFIFSDKRTTKDRTYYVITGKHKNKFMGLIDINTIFFELKQNIEKAMGEKAKKLSLKKIEKSLEQGKRLDI